MGKRYIISRSFLLNVSNNCTVSAKHSVNALKGKGSYRNSQGLKHLPTQSGRSGENLQ